MEQANWRTDPDHGRYVLLCVGAEYALALALVSLASLLVAATAGSIDARLPWAIGIAWLLLPVLLVAGELARGAWQMEFLPGFLFPISFLSFVAGAVAVGFGSIAGIAGGVPILFTIFFGRMLGPAWHACRPFENVYRAIIANTAAVAIAFVPIMALVFLLLPWIVRVR